MRPIKLELETIRVESFATARPGRPAGTVMAFQTDEDDTDLCKASNEATCDTCVGPNCTNVCSGDDCPAVG